jgi:hypothetical protein
MPTYEYECPKHGITEIVHPMSWMRETMHCPGRCGRILKPLISLSYSAPQIAQRESLVRAVDETKHELEAAGNDESKRSNAVDRRRRVLERLTLRDRTDHRGRENVR